MTQISIKTAQAKENIFDKILMLLQNFDEILQTKRAMKKETQKGTERSIGCFYSDYY